MSEQQTKFYNRIYGKYYKLLYQYSLAALDDPRDAEDCVQATFLVAAEKVKRLENHENVGGWLMQTLKYKIYRLIKKKKRWGEILISLEDVSAYKAIEDLADRQPDEIWLPGGNAKAQIEVFHDILSEWEFHVLQAHYIDNESYQSIAKRMGRKENAVYVCAHRAKHKIMDYYKKDD